MNGLKRYNYPESADAPFVPSLSEWDQAPDAGETSVWNSGDDRAASADFEQRIIEKTRSSFEAGRTRGAEEGRAAEHAANAAALAIAEEQRIRHAAELVREFQLQRNRYFQSVEQEVVKLALAVAARILRREAQSDPLLLVGAVRVALGQIAASTEVRLRVPAEDLDLWTEAIALLPNLGTKPEVIVGEGMRLGECVIETRLGNADVGIPHQLVEIERGVLGQRDGQDADAMADVTAIRGE